jgi:hypothetical protein
MKNYSTLILITFVVFGCKTSGEKGSYFSEFSEKYSLNGNVVDLNGIIGNPFQILLLDSLLIINEGRNDNLLFLYNLNTGNLHSEFGNVGDGPDEFSPPLRIALAADKRMLYINERRKFKFREYYLDDRFKMNLVNEFGPFSPEIQILNKFNDDLFLAVGIFEEGRFRFYDKNLDEISSFGSFPDIPIITANQQVENKIGNDVKGMIFQVRLGIKSDKTKIAVAHSLTGILEVYEVSGNTTVKVSQQSVSKSVELKHYSSGNILQATLDDAHPRGYSDIYTSEDYIYLLYSGQVQGNMENTHLPRTSIHVFDWDGNHKWQYELDRQVSCFTINSGGEKLYAVSDEANPALIVYDLQ